MRSHLVFPEERALMQRGDLPAYERIADRLVDALLDVDEVLGILKADDAAALRWIEPDVRRTYEELDQMLRRICD